MRARFVALIALGLSGACRLGARPDTFPPAQGPRGADVQLNRALWVELLAVTDTAFVVRNMSGRILLAPFGSIRQADFRQLGRGYDIVSSRGPDAAHRDRLRLIARFPQGLTPELLRQLLAAAGQDAPDVFR